MLTTREVMEWTIRRFGLKGEERHRYTKKSLERLVAAGAVVVVPDVPLTEILQDYLKLVRDDGERKTIVLPSCYQIPFSDSNTIVKDVTENAYHGLHLPRFVQPAVKAVGEKRGDASLLDWAATQKTLTQQVIRETGLRPEDIVPYALAAADPLPERGTGIKRPRVKAKEPRPKIGRGYWNLAQRQFILFPYVSVIDGFRILARSEMKGAHGAVTVWNRYRDGREMLFGRVTPAAGGEEYTQWIAVPEESGPLAPWLVDCRCSCEDFAWRGTMNRRMASPTEKWCKHLVATALKGEMVKEFPYEIAPSPLGSSAGFALRRAYELETRVLVWQENGTARALNKTEESWWLGVTEQWLVQNKGYPSDAMFGYRLPFSAKGALRKDYVTLKGIEEEQLRNGPPGYRR